ncbi:hypothetical protein PWT90_08595 [Aphanocladium album]|nr:hypothetical protein PWT90_08595 [Aphanocladium album]
MVTGQRSVCPLWAAGAAGAAGAAAVGGPPPPTALPASAHRSACPSHQINSFRPETPQPAKKQKLACHALLVFSICSDHHPATNHRHFTPPPIIQGSVICVLCLPRPPSFRPARNTRPACPRSSSS